MDVGREGAAKGAVAGPQYHNLQACCFVFGTLLSDRQHRLERSYADSQYLHEKNGQPEYLCSRETLKSLELQ